MEIIMRNRYLDAIEFLANRMYHSYMAGGSGIPDGAAAEIVAYMFEVNVAYVYQDANEAFKNRFKEV
jgi:hypothetical protein